MNTTPLDLDTLKALEQVATTPAPWEVTKLHTTDTKVVITDEKDGYAVGTILSLPDAALITTMRNALPALLDELARTRAAHDETIHAARGFSQMAIAEADRLRAEVTTWKRKAVRLREELGNAQGRISAAATVQVWTNEDGERFVFADELMAALDPQPDAAPAAS